MAKKYKSVTMFFIRHFSPLFIKKKFYTVEIFDLTDGKVVE